MKRFWSKVEISDPHSCWVWTAFKNPKGYGMFWFEGRMSPAHRFSYMTVNGTIPEGFDVHHEIIKTTLETLIEEST